jgi:hypothetical protein
MLKVYNYSGCIKYIYIYIYIYALRGEKPCVRMCKKVYGIKVLMLMLFNKKYVDCDFSVKEK